MPPLGQIATQYILLFILLYLFDSIHERSLKPKSSRLFFPYLNAINLVEIYQV